MPVLKPYTFAIRTSQQQKPKIAKEYAFANAINRTKRMKKGITKYINHWAISD